MSNEDMDEEEDDASLLGFTGSTADMANAIREVATVAEFIAYDVWLPVADDTEVATGKKKKKTHRAASQEHFIGEGDVAWPQSNT